MLTGRGCAACWGRSGFSLWCLRCGFGSHCLTSAQRILLTFFTWSLKQHLWASRFACTQTQKHTQKNCVAFRQTERYLNSTQSDTTPVDMKEITVK